MEQMERGSGEVWNLTKAKPKKTLTGKIKSYTVPAEVWDNQTVTRMDAEASRAAQSRWNEEMQRFSDTPIALENARLRGTVKQLQTENRKLKGEVSAAANKNAVEMFSIRQENRNLKEQLESQERGFVKRINSCLAKLPKAAAEKFVELWQRSADQLERSHDHDREMEL